MEGLRVGLKEGSHKVKSHRLSLTYSILPVHAKRVSVPSDLGKKDIRMFNLVQLGLCISIHLADRYAAR